MNRIIRWTGSFTAAVLLFGIAGCATKTVKKGPTRMTVSGISDAASMPDTDEEPSIRGSMLQKVSHHTAAQRAEPQAV